MYLLILTAIAQIFNPIGEPTAEIEISIRIPIKEAKSEIEIRPVILEAKTWHCSI